jgi:hypothetical protein
MKTVIRLANSETGRINLSDFNKKAQKIFKKEVLVQINRSKTIDKPAKLVGCNNPV